MIARDRKLEFDEKQQASSNGLIAIIT